MFYSIEYESFITRNPLLILYNNGIGKITKECYIKIMYKVSLRKVTFLSKMEEEGKQCKRYSHNAKYLKLIDKCRKFSM